MEEKNKIPKVFLSYARTNSEYADSIMEFAYALREDGIDASVDEWDLKLGDDIYYFMESKIKSEADFVLLMINDEFTKKANDRKGGVGAETQMISKELYENVEQNKENNEELKEENKENINNKETEINNEINNKEKNEFEPNLKDKNSSENIPEQNKEDEKKEDNKEQNPEITPNDTKKSEVNNDRKSRLQARLAKSKAALKKKEEEMKYRASAKIKSKASLYEDKLPKKDEV